MNHYKINPTPWNENLKIKAGMVVVFQNGYYQNITGVNSGEPEGNSDFIFIGEVNRFESLASIEASNLNDIHIQSWLNTLNIYTRVEVNEFLTKKADLVGGKVPANQLPSYVDDVIEGYYQDGDFYQDSNLTQFISGEAGKLYLDLFKSETYRWTGSIYLKVGGSLKLGIADEDDGTNGYQVVNENLSILSFSGIDFEYNYTPNPQDPNLNTPTISLKIKPLGKPNLTNRYIPFWDSNLKNFNDSVLYQTEDLKIGVGKTEPTQKVDIEGNIKANALVSKTYTVAERNAIPNPVEGMIIYQSESPKGFYKYENSAWTQIGANISNSDLTNTSARTFTQANSFTWNTAGQFYYLKGLLDKTGNAAYMKSVVVHATTGEKVTRDADDPVVVTSAINKASTAQKTTMRTALLGTATPASPVINHCLPSFIKKNETTIVDLSGLNLTLLDPSFIWIEYQGTKIYADLFFNVTSSLVRTTWTIPDTIPDGVYDVKIQNGVTAQGSSTGKLYVNTQLNDISLVDSNWTNVLPSGASPTTNGNNIRALNFIQIQTPYSNIQPQRSLWKTHNFIQGNKDYEIRLRIVYGSAFSHGSSPMWYIGLSRTDSISDINSFIVDTNIPGSFTDFWIHRPAAGTYLHLVITKTGDKVAFKYYNNDMQLLAYSIQTLTDTVSPYCFYIHESGSANGTTNIKSYTFMYIKERV